MNTVEHATLQGTAAHALVHMAFVSTEPDIAARLEIEDWNPVGSFRATLPDRRAVLSFRRRLQGTPRKPSVPNWAR